MRCGQSTSIAKPSRWKPLIDISSMSGERFHLVHPNVHNPSMSKARFAKEQTRLLPTSSATFAAYAGYR